MSIFFYMKRIMLMNTKFRVYVCHVNLDTEKYWGVISDATFFSRNIEKNQENIISSIHVCILLHEIRFSETFYVFLIL